MSDQTLTTVADVMTKEIISVDATATVHDATQLMRQNGTSSVLVNRKGEQDEYGLVVVSDIASKVLAENLSPDRVNVYEVMSKPVMTVPAEMSMANAVKLLTKFSISRALVVDHERNAVGIVSLRDMVLRNIEEIEAE